MQGGVLEHELSEHAVLGHARVRESLHLRLGQARGFRAERISDKGPARRSFLARILLVVDPRCLETRERVVREIDNSLILQGASRTRCLQHLDLALSGPARSGVLENRVERQFPRGARRRCRSLLFRGGATCSNAQSCEHDQASCCRCAAAVHGITPLAIPPGRFA